MPYKNKEDRKKFAREYYKKYYHAVSKHNPKYIEREKKTKRKYRENNKEKIALYDKAYRENYKGNKEKIALYRKSIRPRLNYYQSKRRLIIKTQCPKWANLEKIKQIYIDCPKGYHVDHIITVVNNNVCGLHVESNLQYLTAEENLKKGNRFKV